MREIKFRCWNTGRRMKKGMYSWEEMIESLDTEFNARKSLFAPFINTPEFKAGQWIKLMQYTGLKDKNGKDIYEGDIIDEVYECDCDFAGHKCYEKSKDGLHHYHSKIIFKKGAFCLKGIGKNDEPEYEGDPLFEIAELDNVEVIGNIYENSELIKII